MAIWAISPPACGQHTLLKLSDFKNAVLTKDSKIIVDVRSAKEFESAHIRNAVQQSTFSQNDPFLYIYGADSQMGINRAVELSDAGYKHVYVLEGGFEAWRAQSLPFVSTLSAKTAIETYSVETYENAAKYHKDVIFYFHADWCKPCKLLEPNLRSFLASNKGFTLIKVNIDKNFTLQSHLEIAEIPTIIVFKKGYQFYRHTGLISAAQLAKELQ